MICIGVGFGILSLVMIILVTRKLYFPVRKFVSYVSGNFGEKGELDTYEDEFAYLQHTYQSAYQKNELLGKQNRKNEPIVFSAFRQLSRAKQTTTRYAGGEKRLYKKTHRSVTIKVFRPIAKER